MCNISVNVIENTLYFTLTCKTTVVEEFCPTGLLLDVTEEKLNDMGTC
jgi:hypothetical protein